MLVRHAPTSWSGRRYAGTSDPPLDAAGVTVARDLAHELAPRLADGVRLVSSPRRRAVTTAEAIAAALADAGRAPARAIEIDDRWAETDFGRFEGRTFADLEALDPDLARRLAAGDLDIDWPGGETVHALAVRVAAAWTELLARAEATVVVSHAGPIRHALGLATGQGAGAIDLPRPGEARWVSLLPAATG